MDEVRQHKTEYDAWGVFNGKVRSSVEAILMRSVPYDGAALVRIRYACGVQVYNLTPYLMYHPGGKDILVKTAGRDCTSLFNKYHPWVNIDGLCGVRCPHLMHQFMSRGSQHLSSRRNWS